MHIVVLKYCFTYGNYLHLLAIQFVCKSLAFSLLHLSDSGKNFMDTGCGFEKS